MKKLTKKLSLNKKTVADLGSGMQANVRGGLINKTDYTYCRDCFTPPSGNTCDPSCAATCVGTCAATCVGTCVSCETACSPCGGTGYPITDPSGNPCQKDNCNF